MNNFKIYKSWLQHLWHLNEELSEAWALAWVEADKGESNGL